MPCNSEYLEADSLEVECSRMFMLLDELDGKGRPDPRSDGWAGYDQRAYGSHRTREKADRLATKLCGRIKKAGDITKYSLELQVWARDHAEADRRRIKEEEAAARLKAAKKSGLAKLTKEERKALGL
jgi:hypothetical protein